MVINHDFQLHFKSYFENNQANIISYLADSIGWKSDQPTSSGTYYLKYKLGAIIGVCDLTIREDRTFLPSDVPIESVPDSADIMFLGPVTMESTIQILASIKPEESNQTSMGVNFDNLRRKLGNSCDSLFDSLKKLFEELDGDHSWETDEVIKAYDSVAGEVIGTYCVYSDDMKNFSDLSDELDSIPLFWEQEGEDNVES